MSAVSDAEASSGASSLRTASAALGIVMALSVVAFVVFSWVVFEEMSYASAHPYAYGPAKVIAAAAAAWALLSAAVAVLARALLRAAR
jgi:hypothetical protein